MPQYIDFTNETEYSEGTLSFSEDAQAQKEEFMRWLDTYSSHSVMPIINTMLPMEDLIVSLDNPLPKELRGRPVKPVVSFEKKVGRNELCSCGSGYKVKKCKCKFAKEV